MELICVKVLNKVSGLRPVVVGMLKASVGFLFLLALLSSKAEATVNKLVVSAERIDHYLPLIQHKKVALVANPSSRVQNTHLVDTLSRLGVEITCVMAPEHGFRGEAEAGEHINGGTDAQTGIRIISLYGDHKKPVREDLSGAEMVVFDLQDVGVRFYTYISTLQYVMEACAEYKIPLIVLDRPNPNANYVDGPVLEEEFRSFVGLQKIPVVYGMTIGEYALMLNGEKWLQGGVKCDLEVVEMLNYTHSMEITLPVSPSPNLPNKNAVQLYPSLCFFEGTVISIGRGTEWPFQCYGYPENTTGDFQFTPKSIPGKSKEPLYENKICKGVNLKDWVNDNRPEALHLNWLIDTYKSFPQKGKYFNAFFDKLAGTTKLREQIIAGATEEQIKVTWEKDLATFRQTRMKYLLYP